MIILPLHFELLRGKGVVDTGLLLLTYGAGVCASPLGRLAEVKVCAWCRTLPLLRARSTATCLTSGELRDRPRRRAAVLDAP